MQSLKISCTQCSDYHECPKKTRLYINYCGGGIERVKEEIRCAIVDCRSRRGRLFSIGLKIQLQTSPFTNDLPVSSSA